MRQSGRNQGCQDYHPEQVSQGFAFLRRGHTHIILSSTPKIGRVTPAASNRGVVRSGAMRFTEGLCGPARLFFQPQLQALLFEDLSAKQRVVRQVGAQPVGRTQIGLEIPHPPPDGAQTIENRPSMERCLGQFLRRHLRGAEGGMVEPVSGVQPPLSAVEQTPLGQKLLIERRARIGHEDVEGGKSELVLQRKLQRALNGGRGVMVVSQGKGRPGLQSVIAQDLQLRPVGLKAAGQIGRLLHGMQVVRIERFEADHMPQAAALGHEGHQLTILRHVNARL